MPDDSPSEFRLTCRELLWVNNCLNELLTSDEPLASEYELRIGGSKDEVQRLLEKVHVHLAACPSTNTE